MKSIPLLAPLYEPADLKFEEAKLAVCVFELSSDFDIKKVEPNLENGSSKTGIVVFADYPSCQIGPYKEVLILISANLHGKESYFCPFIFVDLDAAMAFGREVWGFPKKMAEISLEFENNEYKGNVSGKLIRRGETLIEMNASCNDTVDFDSVRSMLENTPILNHKVVPSVEANKSDLDLITSVDIEYDIHSVFTGTGTVRTSGEITKVLPETNSSISFSATCNMLLPLGSNVKNLLVH